MTHLVTFTSSQFDVTAETPNPINPIAGEGILIWLREKLLSVGYEVTAPEPEDWGWYVYVKDRESSYLVGASSDLDQSGPREWAIQIHRERSLAAKLLGRSRLVDNDAVSVRIEAFIRESSGARDVHVDRSA
ncbi:MAG: hypothetical protein SXG53_29205 [Pseudomonadota bacterium]|nr:hypothetical protein [Pseudomonadota bacterium]